MEYWPQDLAIQNADNGPAVIVAEYSACKTQTWHSTWSTPYFCQVWSLYGLPFGCYGAFLCEHSCAHL